MVYNPPENYNLVRSRTQLLARQEHRINDAEHRYYKVISQWREAREHVTFIETEATAMVKYSCRAIS